MSKTTTLEVSAVLEESEGAEFPPPGSATKASAKAISLSGFKTAWPTKIRPVVLACVNILNMFRQTTAATYVAQAVAFIDLVIGGQIA